MDKETQDKMNRLFVARREAEQALRAALDRHEDLCVLYVTEHAKIRTGKEREEFLAGMLRSNRSQWSGGATTPVNIIEAHMRDAALGVIIHGS